MRQKIPKIVLIGAGRFGKNHLRILLELEKEKRLKLGSVIVKTKKTAKEIERKFKVKTFTNFKDSLLSNADAIDIVTPSSTHFEIVKKCLNFSHVFVEKPLAMSEKEARILVQKAKGNKKILVVGHIFRFNPTLPKIKEIIKKNYQKLYFIEGKFLSPGKPNEDCGAIVTYLHLFDVLDYVLDRKPSSIYAKTSTLFKKNGKFEDEAKIILSYDGNLTAFLELGWVGLKKIRSLNLSFLDMEVYCDLSIPKIEILKPGGRIKKLNFSSEEPLKKELKYFIETILGKHKPYPDGEIGARVAKIVDKAYKSASKGEVIYLSS